MPVLGRHILLELYDCDTVVLKNLRKVRAGMVEAARRAQATIITVTFHEFNSCGISGVVVIATSHLCIHTWPEYRYAAVDIFSCGEVMQPQAAIDHLVQVLAAERIAVVEIQRGMVAPRPVV
jgi:S-adenosylmethionine decarboxylase